MAFVDNSTGFLEREDQLQQVLVIVQRFEELSGLFVQPAKSVLMVINTAVEIKEYEGIPLIQHGDTTRYLGYHVGTGDLVDANWALWVRNFRKRLATAAGSKIIFAVLTLLLNSIMRPAVIFTAAVFQIPKWAKKEL